MEQRGRQLFVCLIASLGLIVVGCSSSPPLGEVEGVVRVGGKPLADVLVTFLPDTNQDHRGERAAGKTDAAGRYRLRREQGQIGTTIGVYRVVIEDLAIYSAPRSADGTLLAKPPVRFSPQLAAPLQTPLRREVKAGAQTIDFDLD